jgi:hypothetical protein
VAHGFGSGTESEQEAQEEARTKTLRRIDGGKREDETKEKIKTFFHLPVVLVGNFI